MRPIIRSKMGVLLLSLLGLAGPAEACVNLNFVMPQTTFDLTGNPSPVLNLTVRAVTSTGGCSYFLTFGYGSGSSPSTRALRQSSYQWPFNLYKDASLSYVLREFADASSLDHVVDGSFPQSPGLKQQVVSYRPVLDQSNAYLRFGAYAESFTISLYEGTIGSATLRQTRTMTLTYTAPKKIDLSLVGAGGAYDAVSTSRLMDFGPAMTVGQTEAVDLLVRYNAGYRVKLSSLRDGVMKHQTQPQTIPYTFTFNGSGVSLAGSSGSPVTVTSGTGVAPVGGERFPIQAQIGSLAGASAGTYEDEITVTVESTE